MKTISVVQILANTAKMRVTLPEVSNPLFRLKEFAPVDQRVVLKFNEEFSFFNMPMLNPYPNVEIMLFLPNEKSRFLVCACSMN